jgi:hypothetical protein
MNTDQKKNGVRRLNRIPFLRKHEGWDQLLTIPALRCAPACGSEEKVFVSAYGPTEALP